MLEGRPLQVGLGWMAKWPDSVYYHGRVFGRGVIVVLRGQTVVTVRIRQEPRLSLSDSIRREEFARANPNTLAARAAVKEDPRLRRSAS